jgi:hypothetical protein
LEELRKDTPARPWHLLDRYRQLLFDRVVWSKENCFVEAVFDNAALRENWGAISREFNGRNESFSELPPTLAKLPASAVFVSNCYLGAAGAEPSELAKQLLQSFQFVGQAIYPGRREGIWLELQLLCRLARYRRTFGG